MKVLVKIFVLVSILVALLLPAQIDRSFAQSSSVTFAVIGDYGMMNANETAVANLVKSWDPAFVVTTGDNYYDPAGGSGSTKYDNSTGKDYCPFLAGITTSGNKCPQPGPASINRFFPSMGNHEYSDAGLSTYTNYFKLPGNGVLSTGTSGNERYYDFIQGPVHFFIVNSNNGAGQEPDGTSANSVQASWLQTQLAASTTPWQIVVFHHPPYSSSNHGSNPWMQWPFAQWGADAVLSGHDHNYERIVRDGIVYFVNGTGGGNLYNCESPVQGSQFCLKAYGAQRVVATETSLDFEFYSVDGALRDSHHIGAGDPTPQPTPTQQVTTTPPPGSNTIHVGDLDKGKNVGSSKWTAKVTVKAHDDDDKAKAGVVVTGSWSIGGTSNCTTNKNGTCVLKLTGIPLSTRNVTLTINSLSLANFSYIPADNHDVDGSSDGNSIKVNR